MEFSISSRVTEDLSPVTHTLKVFKQVVTTFPSKYSELSYTYWIPLFCECPFLQTMPLININYLKTGPDLPIYISKELLSRLINKLMDVCQGKKWVETSAMWAIKYCTWPRIRICKLYTWKKCNDLKKWALRTLQQDFNNSHKFESPTSLQRSQPSEIQSLQGYSCRNIPAEVPQAVLEVLQLTPAAASNLFTKKFVSKPV